jgi:hypothetical protein
MSLFSLTADKTYGLAGIYNNNTDSIYSSPSIYGNETPNSDLIQQPYIWVEPGGNLLTELTTIPIVGDIINQASNLIIDETRIGKFLLSGKGLAFLATQALLQGQNAFNETSLYDPLSVPLTIATDATLGTIEAPTRFIPIDALLPGPAGTLTAALPSTNLDEASGLQRARTAAAGYSSFLTRFGGTAPISTLIEQIATSLLPNLVPIGVQDGTYKVGDDTIYPTMLSNLSKNTSLFGYYDNNGNLINAKQNYTNGSENGSTIDLGISIASALSSLVGGSSLSAGSVTSADGTYTSAVASTTNQSIIAEIWSSWSTSQGQGGLPVSTFGASNDVNTSANSLNVELQSVLSNISTAPQSVLSAYNPISGLSSILSSATAPGLSGVTSALSGILGGSNAITSLSGGSTSKLFPSYASGPNRIGVDKYNALPVTKGSKTNSNAQFNSGGVSALNDLIEFYFTDLFNGVFIPFRATLTSLDFDNSAKWTPVNYIGRADRLFVYEGFEKNITFGFKVYANSPEELLPMWQRVNYLVSLLSPAGYTAASQIASDFIVPPFVKITIGDLCKNQPVVLTSVGVSIPEEASWELTSDAASYSFLSGLITRSATVAQVPMLCEINVNASLLEKTAPAAGVNQFGDVITGGSFSSGLSNNNGTTVNGSPLVGGSTNAISGLVSNIPGASSVISTVNQTVPPQITNIVTTKATQFLTA